MQKAFGRRKVVSNGKHAEYVSVPPYCAKVPDSVTDEETSFTDRKFRLPCKEFG